MWRGESGRTTQDYPTVATQDVLHCCPAYVRTRTHLASFWHQFQSRDLSLLHSLSMPCPIVWGSPLLVWAASLHFVAFSSPTVSKKNQQPTNSRFRCTRKIRHTQIQKWWLSHTCTSTYVRTYLNLAGYLLFLFSQWLHLTLLLLEPTNNSNTQHIPVSYAHCTQTVHECLVWVTCSYSSKDFCFSSSNCFCCSAKALQVNKHNY